MSMIHLSYDTKTKQFDVEIDGETITNLKSARFEQMQDMEGNYLGYCCLTMMDKDKENKTEKVLHMYAANDPRIKITDKVYKLKSLPDFLIVEE